MEIEYKDLVTYVYDSYVDQLLEYLYPVVEELWLNTRNETDNYVGASVSITVPKKDLVTKLPGLTICQEPGGEILKEYTLLTSKEIQCIDPYDYYRISMEGLVDMSEDKLSHVFISYALNYFHSLAVTTGKVSNEKLIEICGDKFSKEMISFNVLVNPFENKHSFIGDTSVWISRLPTGVIKIYGRKSK